MDGLNATVLGHAEVGHADMTDLALLDQTGHGAPGFLEVLTPFGERIEEGDSHGEQVEVVEQIEPSLEALP